MIKYTPKCDSIECLTMQSTNFISNILKIIKASPINYILPIISIVLVNSVWSTEMGCPILRHGYGPYDYRSATREQLLTVEGAHFFPNVENLRENTLHPSRDYLVIPGKEIDYTLRAFPNHHRALMAVSRLSLREKSDRPQGLRASVDCYFNSALEFRPDDSYIFVIYGIHLLNKGKKKEALEYLDKAKSMGDESASLHYNLGLAYFQLKRYDDSLESAHKTYAAGFPLPGLKNMLVRAGKWKDETPGNINLENEKSQPDESADRK
jgi:hypothetical protein